MLRTHFHVWWAVALLREIHVFFLQFPRYFANICNLSGSDHTCHVCVSNLFPSNIMWPYWLYARLPRCHREAAQACVWEEQRPLETTVCSAEQNKELFFLITAAGQIKNSQMPSPSKWFCNIWYDIFVILYTQFHQLKFNLQIWARSRTHVSEVRSDAVTSCSGLGFFGHLCGCVLNIGYTTYTQNSTCRSETCLDLRGLFWILDFRMTDKER